MCHKSFDKNNGHINQACWVRGQVHFPCRDLTFNEFFAQKNFLFHYLCYIDNEKSADQSNQL